MDPYLVLIVGGAFFFGYIVGALRSIRRHVKDLEAINNDLRRMREGLRS